MFDQRPLLVLLGIFIASSVVVWFAGIKLAKSTDVISKRFNLGAALGGMIILAIVTDLPEITIMIGASLSHRIGLATGNILGGVAMQTAILVLLDAIGVKGPYPLTSRLKNLIPVLEANLVVAILITAILASELPHMGKFPFGEIVITIYWVAGLWLINKARSNLPWQEKKVSQVTKVDQDTRQIETERNEEQDKSSRIIWLAFSLSVIATLVAGYYLEESSQLLAQHFGMNNIIFGATILAFVTSLPELTTGFASIRIGEYQLAVGDILGSNAFLPVIFILNVFITRQSAFPAVPKTDIYIAALGILMTAIYIFGLIFRSDKRIFRMGLDSCMALITYVLGILGLFFIW